MIKNSIHRKSRIFYTSTNSIKTVALMSILAALLMAVGNLLGGTTGIAIAAAIALVMNGIIYFYSDKLIVRLHGAEPLNRNTHGALYNIVEELCAITELPMPKLWIIHTPVANAFATGRNPRHSAIVVTSGILTILEPQELRGVLAHELAHIANRDILLSTIAAALATAIGYAGNMLYYSERRDRTTSTHLLSIVVTTLCLPLITLLIRMGISRSREYLADESGAHTCQDPLALASALNKLHTHTQHTGFAPEHAAAHTTANLFIVKPFSGTTLFELLSTHPPIKKRVAALYKMHEKQCSH